jgi:prepilin-type N-terminal cleavage/methylation domain-containing protein
MRKARGFTLVEIAIVLVIVGMIVALFASITTTLLSSQRRQTTTNHLALVDAALIQFVVQNKRLPCPSDGNLASTNASAGIEPVVAPLGPRDVATGCASQTGGVVPWRALGLGEQDATDGWGRRITYRAFNVLTADSAMNMFWCDPAGTGVALVAGACNTACTSAVPANCSPPNLFLAAKGFQIRNLAGTILMDPPSGAAYVLISHGESGGGGFTSAGVLAPSLSTDGTEEQQKNYASLGTQPYYVDNDISDVAGATHFDDVVVRTTMLNAVTRAGLGPRAHP